MSVLPDSSVKISQRWAADSAIPISIWMRRESRKRLLGSRDFSE